MSIRCHLLLVASLACSTPGTVGAEQGPNDNGAETRPPNVVFILADDLGWRDLGCYGSTFYETPNLDRLASEGVRFTNAYASCPVCSPSRAAVMTGKNPARIGLTAHIGDPGPKHWNRDTPLLPASYVDRLPHSETTLAEAFHDAGYATMHAGKWHLGHEPFWPEYQGFDVNVGGYSQGGPFGGKQYFSPYGNPRLADGPEGEHLPDRLATETARFIEAHRFEPFFIHLAWYSVHVPLVAREDLIAKYQAKLDAEAPANEMQTGRDSEERVRQDHVVYAAMVEAMDQAVGKVLKSLDDAGVAGQTIVVFTSDNGGLSTGDLGISPDQGWPTTNAPLRAGKGWMYEGGIRVPLIVKTPGSGAPGSESDRVVSGADYYATLFELTGLPAPANQAIDSESFASALSGNDAHRPPAFWHYPHYGNQGGRPGGAVRDGDWKLIEWYAADPSEAIVELYNLADDPSESNDLSVAESSRRETMLAQLRAWRESIDARMPTPQTRPVAQQPTDRRAASAEGGGGIRAR